MFAEQMLMKMQTNSSGLTLNISASSWHVVLEMRPQPVEDPRCP
ncbi:unnamed protein product [Acanthoscelides obtectus]|uniref:Uncharacterized protein n=1 Tax=Acanthoscelides obtectus TaxID=200917 RepID=A0A9P0QJC6_ACAOB|nr:unnamed protein product [Acanthoscelides obtectus]CAK1685913.1 hypothetical protein AOBTE_LOCUS35712 [Acanthoscelides obtectus]